MQELQLGIIVRLRSFRPKAIPQPFPRGFGTFGVEVRCKRLSQLVGLINHCIQAAVSTGHRFRDPTCLAIQKSLIKLRQSYPDGSARIS